jgi:hypothetical protein
MRCRHLPAPLNIALRLRGYYTTFIPFLIWEICIIRNQKGGAPVQKRRHEWVKF